MLSLRHEKKIDDYQLPIIPKI